MSPRLIVPRLTISTFRRFHSHHHFSTIASKSFKMASSQQQQSTAAPDWSANQYLKFGNERTRAVSDLVAQIPLESPKRIFDLGCGPGNSTAVLASRWPNARITGMDSSPDMLLKARNSTSSKNIDFVEGDLQTFSIPQEEQADLLFSNAVFHWLRSEERIPTILRLLQSQKQGTVLAFQVPDNYDEPSHKSMRETALLDGPWTPYFQSLPAEKRPDLDPIEAADVWYNALIPHCSTVDIWHTFYQHVMPGPGAIVEWVKGTGLMPFLNALPDPDVREAYLKAYEKRLSEVYAPLVDGKVMLRYPRLFVVARRA